MTRAGVRVFLVCQAAILSLTIVGAKAPGTDVRGTARAGGRPAANAVVWLDGPNLPPGIPKGRAVLDQRNLAFSPHVLAVRVGTTVDFPNDDRVFHNVFSFRDGKVFDLGLYPVGAVQHVKFDHVGLSRIFCNIHPNMAAYVMVVDTPYFAVSDESGTFAVTSVTPGAYTYHAWRPGAAELNGPLASAATPLAIDWP